MNFQNEHNFFIKVCAHKLSVKGINLMFVCFTFTKNIFCFKKTGQKKRKAHCSLLTIRSNPLWRSFGTDVSLCSLLKDFLNMPQSFRNREKKNRKFRTQKEIKNNAYKQKTKQ